MTVAKSRIVDLAYAEALRRLDKAGWTTTDLANFATGQDIDLGAHGAKWRHGWVPLNAVAAAIKAKTFKGGGGHSSGRSGSTGKTRRQFKALTDGRVVDSAPRTKGKTPARAVQAAKAERDRRMGLGTNPEKANPNAADRKLRFMTAVDHQQDDHIRSADEATLRDVASARDPFGNPNRYGKRAQEELDRRGSSNRDKAKSIASMTHSDSQKAAAARATVKGNKVTHSDGTELGEVVKYGPSQWGAKHANGDSHPLVLKTKAHAAGALVQRHEFRNEHGDASTGRSAEQVRADAEKERRELLRKVGGPSDEEIRAAQKRTGIYPADKLTVKSHGLIGEGATVEKAKPVSAGVPINQLAQYTDTEMRNWVKRGSPDMKKRAEAELARRARVKASGSVGGRSVLASHGNHGDARSTESKALARLSGAELKRRADNGDIAARAEITRRIARRTARRSK